MAMNDLATPYEPALVKALFAKAVKAFGGHAAAGVHLDISRQRVGQLASANPEFAREVPTLAHIFSLESGLGRSIVFAGLVEAIEPPIPHRSATPLKETLDVIRVAAEIGPLAMAAESGRPEAIEAFLNKLDDLAKEACEAKASTANVVKMGAA